MEEFLPFGAVVVGFVAKLVVEAEVIVGLTVTFVYMVERAVERGIVVGFVGVFGQLEEQKPHFPWPLT